MPYEFFDHTGDIGVRVRAGSLGDLFADAAAALTATLVDPSTVLGREREWVSLAAPSLELLLVDWLNDLVFRFDVDEFVVARVAPRIEQQQEEWKLESTLEGEHLEPARHRVKLAVKGVTYHQLEIVKTDRGFETALVFDI